MRRHLHWVLAAFLGGPALHAQVLGNVVDASNQPVVDARVELWAPLRHVAVTLSDSAGGFQFASRGEAVGIVVRRLGCRVANVSLQPVDGLSGRYALIQPSKGPSGEGGSAGW